MKESAIPNGSPLAAPLYFRPVYKDYLWGGDRIPQRFRRHEPPGTYAESWELSAHRDGVSVVAEGPWAGRALPDLVREFGPALLGSRVPPGRFPLLFKIIDARDTLSVQVHPDDETSRTFGGEAKTEMWYVLDAAPGACVYHGFVHGMHRQAALKALEERRLAETLRRVPVHAGDAVFVPGGTVHAIGAGCLLYEIQQSSNTTFRLYDWDRAGPDGKPRPLHVHEALDVTRWDTRGPALAVPVRIPRTSVTEEWEVVRCPYFHLRRLILREPEVIRHDGGSFRVVFVEDGEVVLSAHDSVHLLHGQTWLLPACLTHFTLKPRGVKASVLLACVP